MRLKYFLDALRHHYFEVSKRPLASVLADMDLDAADDDLDPDSQALNERFQTMSLEGQTETMVWECKHPLFKRGQRSNLALIVPRSMAPLP